MTIASPVAHVFLFARWKLFPKVTSTTSILTNASTAEVVQKFVPTTQFIRENKLKIAARKAAFLIYAKYIYKITGE